MKPLHDYSIKTKLLLMLFLPLTGLLYFSGSALVSNFNTVDEMQSLQSLMKLAVISGEVINGVQKERGLSAGFIASHGEKFAPELTDQRAVTDREAGKLTAFLDNFNAKPYGAKFRQSLDTTRSRLNEIGSTRNRVSSMTISAKDAISYYTGLVGSMLDVITEITKVSKSDDIIRGANSYLMLSNGMERTGQERAVMTGVFTADHFEPDSLQRFIVLMADENTYYKLFSAYASADVKTLFQTEMASNSAAEVAAMQKTALDKILEGHFGIDPAHWFKAMSGKIDATKKVEDRLSEELNSLTVDKVSEGRQKMMVNSGIMLASVMLSALMAWLLIRSITTSLHYAVEVARRVAHGDLSSEIQVSSRDEIGELLTALKDMNAGLSHIVGEIRISTEAIASASGQIAAGNLDLSNRTEAQAGSLEETASAMEEITAAVKQNADNAHQANQVAQNASGVAVKGGAAVSEVSNTMLAINESSRRIADIIGVIDGIAFQTNILALNAAVEAARAGEQGRGFAVVATEVRSLAQRSAAAAKEIKSLINDSVAKVERGNEQAAQASSTMSAVVSGVQQVTGIMSEISAASREQSQGIEEINRAINHMDETTQQNAALVEQAAAAAKSLQEQAQHLEELVDKFQLNSVRHNSQRTQSKIISTRSANTVQQAGRVAHKQAVSATKKLTATVRNDNEWEEF